MRRGGDWARGSGEGVRVAGSSGTDMEVSLFNPFADRKDGMCETMLFDEVSSGRGLVKLLMTPSHSLIGRSWLIRITSSLSPLFFR